MLNDTSSIRAEYFARWCCQCLCVIVQPACHGLSSSMGRVRMTSLVVARLALPSLLLFMQTLDALDAQGLASLHIHIHHGTAELHRTTCHVML